MRYDPTSTTHVSPEQAKALGVSPSMYDAILVGGPRAGLVFQTSVSEDGKICWPGMGYHHRGGLAWYRLDPARPLDATGRFVWTYTGTELPPDDDTPRRGRPVWVDRVIAAIEGALSLPGVSPLPA